MITIRFDSKFQIIAQLFDLIQFEMKKHYSHSTIKKFSGYPIHINSMIITWYCNLMKMATVKCHITVSARVAWIIQQSSTNTATTAQ